MLVAIYALFALAASARAGVQIATKFGNAPVAYLLSAFAAVVYILATVTLGVGTPTARRIAVLSCSVELVGVLAVGTWSLADPATFPDATVWSSYGSGYGFVPLVLPVFGLLWLRRWAERPRTRRTIVTSAGDAGDAAGGGVDHGEGGRPGQGAEDVVADGSVLSVLTLAQNVCCVSLRGRRRFLPWGLCPADWRRGSGCGRRRRGESGRDRPRPLR
jgi:hypothetical protein